MHVVDLPQCTVRVFYILRKNFLIPNVIMSENSDNNKWVDWIEDGISKKHIKYYERENFSNIQEIGSGGFGRVYRANWKNSHRFLALKSFFNFDSNTAKEIVHEVIIIYIFIFII